MASSVESLWSIVDPFGCTALFNTPCFLFFFLPIALTGFWIIRHQGWRLAWLTLASLWFYSLWNVNFTVLLILVAVANFLFGLLLDQASALRRVVVTFAVVFNLAILAFYKYATFLAENLATLLRLGGAEPAFGDPGLILPVGISFFTFQAMSYVLDVNRGLYPATRNFLHFLCYIALFPQLVAGPIVRFSTVRDQLLQLAQRVNWPQIHGGVAMFVIGLAKKVLIADNIAPFVDDVWDDPGAATFTSAWVAAVGFALQLYFDFSGYSDMAIGLGRLFGLEFPVNFRAPYHARNPREFWQRWHITLSSFLRDYLYIPLGGDRRSPARRDLNILIVMFLGGLWHGAAWTFAVWGLYHGLLVVAYRRNQARWDGLPLAIQHIGFVGLVVVGWVWFRAPDFGSAATMFQAMFGFAALGAMWPVLAGLVAALAIAMVLRPAVEWTFRHSLPEAVAWAVLLLLSVITMNSINSPFIYYQF